MVLVDTSVWIDYFRSDNRTLVDLLDRGEVLGHPWVTGELALGNLREGDEILELLDHLPQAPIATVEELLGFIAQHGLAGSGIGYVDAQLLAATRLEAGATLWTRDRKLLDVATRMGIAMEADQRRR